MEIQDHRHLQFHVNNECGMQVNSELEITLTDFSWRFFLGACYKGSWASQVALLIKNTTANAGGMRDVGSVPELRRSPGGGHDNPL